MNIEAIIPGCLCKYKEQTHKNKLIIKISIHKLPANLENISTFFSIIYKTAKTYAVLVIEDKL